MKIMTIVIVLVLSSAGIFAKDNSVPPEILLVKQFIDIMYRDAPMTFEEEEQLFGKYGKNAVGMIYLRMKMLKFTGTYSEPIWLSRPRLSYGGEFVKQYLVKVFPQKPKVTISYFLAKNEYKEYYFTNKTSLEQYKPSIASRAYVCVRLTQALSSKKMFDRDQKCCTLIVPVEKNKKDVYSILLYLTTINGLPMPAFCDEWKYRLSTRTLKKLKEHMLKLEKKYFDNQ